MPVTTRNSQTLVFSDVPDVDEVLLYIEHDAPAVRFTLVNYSNAWTGYFRDLSEMESPIDRFISTSVHDLARLFQWGTPEVLNREKAKETVFLRHIIASAQTAIKDQIAPHALPLEEHQAVLCPAK